MTSQTISLAIFELKRLLRHRALAVVLVALPVAAGIASVLFDTDVTHTCARLCLLVCAAVSAGIVVLQQLLDNATGLNEAIRSCPVSDRTLVVSRAITWIVVFGLQMALLAGILKIGL